LKSEGTRLALERVLLVRHGLTDWNVQGRWQGYEPVALNQDGWVQARTLARALKGRSFGEIISSDLPRAFETATAIGEVVGLSPRADERWREFNMGIFQGHTRDEIIQTYPAEWADFHANYWDFHIPGGESRRMMQDRIYAAWLDIITSTSHKELIIVSHGGSLKMLLVKLFPDAPNLDSVHLGNTSVTTLERTDYGWHLVQVASVEHLASPSSNATGEAAL
jgi:broad specificity phosphatase PhoE